MANFFKKAKKIPLPNNTVEGAKSIYQMNIDEKLIKKSEPEALPYDQGKTFFYNLPPNYILPSSNLVSFKLNIKDMPLDFQSTLASPGESMQPKYKSCTMRENFGYLEKVYDYKPVYGVPTITKGVVMLEGLIVGAINLTDRIDVKKFIDSGAHYYVKIEGGPYKMNNGGEILWSGKSKIKATLYFGMIND